MADCGSSERRFRTCALPRCALASALLRAGLPTGGLSRTAFLRGCACAAPWRRLLARFAQTDGDRLLAALHLRVTTLPALERARFALVHRALHALARGLAVLARARFSSWRPCFTLRVRVMLLVPRRAPRRALERRGRNDRSRATPTASAMRVCVAEVRCACAACCTTVIFSTGAGASSTTLGACATTREHERRLERRHAECRPGESDDDSPERRRRDSARRGRVA